METLEQRKIRQERDALLGEVKALREALADVLDAGELVWSEADNAMVFCIWISEAHEMDIRGMLMEKAQ